MIRCGVNNPDRPFLLMGLSEGNIERLKAGKPIKADLRSFGVDLPGTLAVIYGKSEADLEAELRESGLIDEFTEIHADPGVDQEATARREHDKILIATVGLPRSGKSTWARSQAYPVVNPDSIRLALHGQRFYGPAEPLVWATAKLMVRSLFLAGHKTIILDATNVERKRRDEWRSKEWGLFFKSIDTPKETCLDRAAAEADAEIVPVIERMAAGFEPLGSDERPW